MSYPKLVEDLDPGILKEVSLHLNPPMVVGSDWRSLAGKFGMKYRHIRNFALCSDPTMEVLQEWWSEKGDRTVTALIKILKSMNRNDVVLLLEPHEFCVISTEQASPEEKKISTPAESTEEPLGIALPRSTPPNTLAIASNGHDSHGSSRPAGKPGPTENSSNHRTYAIQSDSDINLVDDDSEPELENGDENPNGLSDRGSERNHRLVATSVQTQIPSPTVATDVPAFPSPVMESQSGVPSSKALFAPQDKIALVIGNQNYTKQTYRNLSYALNDAYDIASALDKLGFKVLSLMDLTLTEMRTAMLAFCRLLGQNIFAVFYFSGHGYELEGENYLLPVDANSSHPNESIRAQEFLQEMQSCESLLNLMFLDCCRSRATEKISKNCYLKRTTKGNNIIAYSCCSQHRAYEEPQQKNGVYAKHLLKNIHRDIRIETILMDVNAAVMDSLSVDQRPTFESDAYLECRLTAPIIPDMHKQKERYLLWKQGSRLPQPLKIELESFEIVLKFLPGFNNCMATEVEANNKSHKEVKNLKFVASSFPPIILEQQSKTVDLKPGDQNIDVGTFRIFSLQKLCNESLFLSIDFRTEEESFLKKLDLGTPMISGITNKFHDWITDRKYETPSGAMSSWH